MPGRRVVIRFHFDDDDLAYDTYWMVTQPCAEIERSTSDPAFDIDLFIETEVVSLGGVLIGRTSLARELERGSLFLSGDAILIRTMDRWLSLGEYAQVEGIAALPAARTRSERVAKRVIPDCAKGQVIAGSEADARGTTVPDSPCGCEPSFLGEHPMKADRRTPSAKPLKVRFVPNPGTGGFIHASDSR